MMLLTEPCRDGIEITSKWFSVEFVLQDSLSNSNSDCSESPSNFVKFKPFERSSWYEPLISTFA